MQRKVSCLVVLGFIVFHSAAAADPVRREPRAQSRSSSTGKRVAWTLIGAGIGFGAGLYLGLRQFDDAINSDRKVWTSALAGAAAGGIAGAWLSGRGSSTPALRPVLPLQVSSDVTVVTPSPFGARRAIDRALRDAVRAYNAESGAAAAGFGPLPRQPKAVARKPDSLRNGMIVGAAVGAVVGLLIVPNQECKSSNPECPRMLRIGVGIPAVASGAAIGALVDKMFEE